MSMPQLRGRPHPSILFSLKRKRVKRNPLGTLGIYSITHRINLYPQGIKQLFFLILKLILYIRWEVIYPVDCYPPFEQLKDQIRWSLRTLTYFRSSLPSTRCLFEFWASRPFKLAKFHWNQRERAWSTPASWGTHGSTIHPYSWNISTSFTSYILPIPLFYLTIIKP